jgi:hypothetical protein
MESTAKDSPAVVDVGHELLGRQPSEICRRQFGSSIQVPGADVSGRPKQRQKVQLERICKLDDPAWSRNAATALPTGDGLLRYAKLNGKRGL